MNPGLSWFQAFCAVIASGGDDDQNQDERRSMNRRRSTMMALRNRVSSLNSNTSGSLRSSSGIFGSYRRQGSRGDMPNVEICEELHEVITKVEETLEVGCSMNEMRSPTCDNVEKQSSDISTRRSSSLTTAELEESMDVESNARATITVHKLNENTPQSRRGENPPSSIRNEREGADQGDDRRRSVRFTFENINDSATSVSNHSRGTNNDSPESKESSEKE